ncbi:MAG: guanylate kinase [Acidobacteria bacterium]|nr:MAG: guanylate kinase [Acidobacteriota bacterium]
MARGELFIVSAPSGAGKSTLIRKAIEGLAGHRGVTFSVSHTTRRPRAGEVEGKDYYFIDREAFEKMIAEDRFLEWANVYEEFKGTSCDEVLPRLEQGIDVILDVDVQGAEQVMERFPESIGIFILPPGPQELSRRLHERGLDEEQEIARRLAVSLWEIKRYPQYQYVIINDDLDRASDHLTAIILEKRPQLERQKERVEQILRDFEAAHGTE